MIIKSYELNKIKNNSNIILFYGKNEGLKNQCIDELLVKKKDAAVLRYDEKEIFENRQIFFENILSNSLFENEKIVIINRCSDKISDLILEIIDRNINEIRIIINAGILEKKSKLRKLFENEKNLSCIATYPDTNDILSKLALTFFEKEKISMSRQNINLIIDKCSGDRLNLKNELEKIKVYSLKKKTLSTEELLKLINLSENHSYAELIDNCLAKNTKKIINILNENNFNNEECILILRTLLSKSKKILKLTLEYSKNKDINKTINSAKPPIFWKDKEITKIQIQKWKPDTIKKLIFLISDIELQIKKNFNNPILILTDFILKQGSLDTNN